MFPTLIDIDYKNYEALDKISNVAMHIVTMGGTMGRREGVYRILSRLAHKFSVVRVLSGSYDNEIAKLCYDYHVNHYWHRWMNDISRQHNLLLSYATHGDWVLMVSDDELPSYALLANLQGYINQCKEIPNATIVRIPYKLVMDGIISGGSVEGFSAEKLFQKTEAEFVGTTHMILDPEVAKEQVRIQAKHCMYHFKSPNAFMFGNVWASLINAEGHGSQLMNILTTMFNLVGIWESDELYSYLVKGNIDEDIKAFIVAHRNGDSCVRHLFYYYFFVLHGEELAEWDIDENGFERDMQEYFEWTNRFYKEGVRVNYGK